MTRATAAIADDDPALESDVAREMVRQMRAIDTYGIWDDWPASKILQPFVLTKEMRREIPIIGDPDMMTVSRAGAFYNAIAAMIEARIDLMAIPVLHVSNEGFGRALITVGRLVVMDRTLRDVHRFGFPTLSKLKDEAQRLVDRAVDLVEAHPEVARL